MSSTEIKQKALAEAIALTNTALASGNVSITKPELVAEFIETLYQKCIDLYTDAMPAE